ncbi:hypothetical protein [Pseudomonas phage PG1]|nr:hypothetical protein [Pseudomonas phage PG1]
MQLFEIEIFRTQAPHYMAFLIQQHTNVQNRVVAEMIEYSGDSPVREVSERYLSGVGYPNPKPLVYVIQPHVRAPSRHCAIQLYTADCGLPFIKE